MPWTLLWKSNWRKDLDETEPPGRKVFSVITRISLAPVADIVYNVVNTNLEKEKTCQKSKCIKRPNRKSQWSG